MSGAITPLELRNAIEKSLWRESAHDLAAVCVALGLPPQQPDENPPMAGKRRYVGRRLIGKSLVELAALARRVAEEYGDQDLLRLLERLGPHGVDGELKNLIFAADGPKPRIVLRDAINNVIEIVEHAEHCLVYDRPLGTGPSASRA